MTSVSEKVATVAASPDPVKTDKVTFCEYAQAKSVKPVVNPVGDTEVASVSFGISSLKIIPDNPLGTSEWNDAVTKEMPNTIPTFNSLASIGVGISIMNNESTTPLEDEEEMESAEDLDNSTIDEPPPPHILKDLFGGLKIVDAPVIDAGSIVVHRNHCETIDIRNAFFRLVDQPGVPPVVVFTPPLPLTRAIADGFLSNTNHDPQVHRNLNGTVYIREFYAPVAPFIPWLPRQFAVWVPPHVLDFVPVTPERAVIRESKSARWRWNRYKIFMIMYGSHWPLIKFLLNVTIRVDSLFGLGSLILLVLNSIGEPSRHG
jgi:hypothetical protein